MTFVWLMRDRIKARVISFGFAETSAGYSRRRRYRLARWLDEERYSFRRAKLQGVHNLENMMAAVAAAKCAGNDLRY